MWSRVGRDTPLLDIGTIAEFTLSTRTVGRTRSMEHTPRRHIHTDRLDYASLINILEMLVTMSHALPDGAEYPEVFREYALSLDYFERPLAENTKNVTIFLLQFARHLGILGEGFLADVHVSVRRVISATCMMRVVSPPRYSTTCVSSPIGASAPTSPDSPVRHTTIHPQRDKHFSLK